MLFEQVLKRGISVFLCEILIFLEKQTEAEIFPEILEIYKKYPLENDFECEHAFSRILGLIRVKYSKLPIELRCYQINAQQFQNKVKNLVSKIAHTFLTEKNNEDSVEKTKKLELMKMWKDFQFNLEWRKC